MSKAKACFNLPCLLKSKISEILNRCLPFHEAGLDEELSEVLADSGARGAHHEVQDDLPALHGVAVQALYIPGVPIRTETAALVCPWLTAEWQERQDKTRTIAILAYD